MSAEQGLQQCPHKNYLINKEFRILNPCIPSLRWQTPLTSLIWFSGSFN